jgi:hypothetical protein
MHPSRCCRDRLHQLSDLPNVGPAMARDLKLLGINTPEELTGRDPLELYRGLCERRAARQDPCVFDVFLSITRFLAGEEPRPWWAYTEERKLRYPDL